MGIDRSRFSDQFNLDQTPFEKTKRLYSNLITYMRRNRFDGEFHEELYIDNIWRFSHEKKVDVIVLPITLWNDTKYTVNWVSVDDFIKEMKKSNHVFVYQIDPEFNKIRCAFIM